MDVAIRKLEPIQEKDESTFKPRPYQEELLAICLEKNTLIYLPTGSGKTFIALMAMRHLAADTDRPLQEGGKRIVFLANTVVLTHQQKKCIEKATSFKTAVYTGDMNVDAWRKDKWIGEFEDNQVLVATCQIILDVLRHGYISMKNLSLIIFDECHHGRREHPMHQLMGHYNLASKNDRPRIIGLTGMLISGSVKPQSVVTDLETLENTFHATIATVQNINEFNNVLLYSTNPRELIKIYEGQSEHPILKKIETIIAKLIEKIEKYPVDLTHLLAANKKLNNDRMPNIYKSLKLLLNDFIYQMKDSGVYGASIAILGVIVELELKKRSCDTATLKKLLRELITGAEYIRHLLVEEMEEDEDDNEGLILMNASPKLLHLLQFLKSYFTEQSGDVKALVFVTRRYTAKCIYHIINKFILKSGNRYPIRPDFMVGNNSAIPESIEQILENKWNRRVLDRFAKNETNLIVASSVLEEGIDLQMCNLVISYDYPKTFRSYVQSKGRARQRDSTYLIMCSSTDYSKLQNKLREYKQVDLILKDYLIGKTIDRPPPLEKDIDEEFAQTLIKPFKTKIGAVLEGTSAVQLVNRYCQTLPLDQFTPSTPAWSKVILESNEIVVKILLPIQSIVKHEISSDPMPSVKLAKRSAAFKACVALYETGELNDNLMPINVKRCLTSINPIYFANWDNYENDNHRTAGTKKQIRSHDIKYPDQTTSCLPMINKRLFLYKIHIMPTFEVTSENENDAILYELYKSDRSFGILTSKELPRLGEMKFYITLGQIRVQIISEPISISLSNAMELNQLRQFHGQLFRHVLQTAKSFLVYDFDNKENSFIIVPITNNAIDWPIVQQFQQIPTFKTIETERCNKIYKVEDYLHKVISPWYRVDQNLKYVVTKVHENLTPESPFPNTLYHSYAAYIYNKYHITVQNKNQFLIEVRGITTHLNRLTPGAGKDGSKMGKTSTFRGPELLIPEFCNNFEFPGDLWLKSTLLPSILHRLHYMLHAELIRLKINRCIGLFNDDYKPESVIEKMVQSPFIDEDEIAPTTNIVYPRPEYTVAKQLHNQDILHSSIYPWSEIEEPIDLNRYLSKVYPLEIDYYYNFINQRMEKLNISNTEELIKNSHKSGFTVKLPAICDTPSEERLCINILDININTPIKGPLQSDLLAALTAASAHDVFDMERLEVIGDAFLKYSVSVFLIQKYPNWHEGFLSNCKGKIVSNRNLCYVAFKTGLPGMINLRQLNPKDEWRPPLMTVPRNALEYIVQIKGSANCLDRLMPTEEEIKNGSLNQNTLYDFIEGFLNDNTADEQDRSLMQNFLSLQLVPDKTVADCLEAILGCCVKSIGIERSFSILKMFEILPKNEPDYVDMIKEKNYNARLRTNINDRDIDSFIINYKNIEDCLGYKFQDRAYLLQALTHPSFPTNRITGCYQQLEFLGDAVLDILISLYIFENCPQMNPGQLTDLRSALVNNVTLACICVRYSLYRHILSQNAVLTENISTFVEFQEQHNHIVTEQVLLLLEEKDSAMGEYVEVPKMLGDILEAIIGAIFLDSGYNLKITWKVIYKLMQNELKLFMEHIPIQVVRRLHEYPGANPQFDDPVVEDDIIMVSVRFTCKGQILQVQGFGQNKENAKKAAAKMALRKLNE